jgi:hypothetical protein
MTMSEYERSRRRNELIKKRAELLSKNARENGLKRGDIKRTWLGWAKDLGRNFTVKEALDAYHVCGGIGTLQSVQPYLEDYCVRVQAGVKGGQFGPTSIWCWSEERIAQRIEEQRKADARSAKWRAEQDAAIAKSEQDAIDFINELFGEV